MQMYCKTTYTCVCSVSGTQSLDSWTQTNRERERWLYTEREQDLLPWWHAPCVWARLLNKWPWQARCLSAYSSHTHTDTHTKRPDQLIVLKRRLQRNVDIWILRKWQREKNAGRGWQMENKGKHWHNCSCRQFRRQNGCYISGSLFTLLQV